MYTHSEREFVERERERFGLHCSFCIQDDSSRNYLHRERTSPQKESTYERERGGGSINPLSSKIS